MTKFLIKLSFFFLLIVANHVFAQNGDFKIHKLAKGETLSALSKKYKVTLAEIKKANLGMGDKLDIGQEIKIPSKNKSSNNQFNTSSTDSKSTSHKVKSGETLSSIAKKYNVSLADLKKQNPKIGDNLKLGQLISIPQNGIVNTEVDEKVEEKASNTNEITSDNLPDYHTVKPKETLFIISKKYKISVSDLKKLNPSATKGLKKGQKIKLKVLREENVQNEQVVSQEVVEEKSTLESEERFHIVKSKQTLYSIAKMHKISVTNLMKWNNLNSKSKIEIGQKLKISNKSQNKDKIAELPDNTISSTSTNPKIEISNKDQDENDVPNNTANGLIVKDEPKESQVVDVDKVNVTSSVAVNASGYSKITETGLAEIINESVETNKFLAMHKTAPIGTLIQVRNPMTDVSIFVRVIGKLPSNSANEKIIIKVSKKVRERIGALNQRFPVEISYIP